MFFICAVGDEGKKVSFSIFSFFSASFFNDSFFFFNVGMHAWRESFIFRADLFALHMAIGLLHVISLNSLYVFLFILRMSVFFQFLTLTYSIQFF